MAMSNYSHNANYNASSVIDDNTIASFSASCYSENSVNFSKTINNISAYIENKDVVDADEAEFQDKVISGIQINSVTTKTTTTATK